MMSKLFPWILWPDVPLFLTFASGSQLLVSAASIDKESEVESVFQKMESDARTLRDELERAYSARCETKTLEKCYKANFNDCYSVFPNQQCLKADEFVIVTCGDGVSCNGKFVY